MPDSPVPTDESRGQIVRDVLIFQVKLWLEGFKDVVLMPLSLGAAVIDLVFRGGKTPGTLYSVMRMGDRFERWVHLYAALDEAEKRTPRENSLDDLLNEAANGIEKQATNGRADRTDANRPQS
jgi:hypothetical protein